MNDSKASEVVRSSVTPTAPRKTIQERCEEWQTASGLRLPFCICAALGEAVAEGVRLVEQETAKRCAEIAGDRSKSVYAHPSVGLLILKEFGVEK